MTLRAGAIFCAELDFIFLIKKKPQYQINLITVFLSYVFKWISSGKIPLKFLLLQNLMCPRHKEAIYILKNQAKTAYELSLSNNYSNHYIFNLLELYSTS